MFIRGPWPNYSPAYSERQVRLINDIMLSVALVICDLIFKDEFNAIQPDFLVGSLLFCILEYLLRCMLGVGVEI